MTDQGRQHLHRADFEDMHLRVGAALQMRQTTAQGVSQFNVQYIGAIKGLSFLTTLPKVGDTAIWLRPGVKVSFRALAGTHVYAFDASTLRARSKPHSYAHFSLPAEVHYRPVRRDPRIEVRLPVELRRPDGTRTLAIMRDLSLRGATLELAGMLAEPGGMIDLEIPVILPELIRTLGLRAAVRNSADLDACIEKGQFRYGVEFEAPEEEGAILLHYYIDHLIAEQHAKY